MPYTTLPLLFLILPPSLTFATQFSLKFHTTRAPLDESGRRYHATLSQMSFSKDRKKKRIREIRSRGRGSHSTAWTCCCIAFTVSSSFGLVQGLFSPVQTLGSTPTSREILLAPPHPSSTGMLPTTTPVGASSNPVPTIKFGSSLSKHQNIRAGNMSSKISSNISPEYESTVTQTIGGNLISTTTSTTAAGPSSTSTVVPASYDIPQPFE